MKFDMRHEFPCPPDLIWELLDDPEFDRRLAAATQAKRVTVENRMDGKQRYIRRSITAKRTLPAPMAKMIGSDEIGWDQETWHEPGTERMRWKITPRVLQGRMTGEGTTIVRATPRGCERVISGDLTVKVALIGGPMEKKLVEDVQQSYENAARILRELIAERAKV
jgi:hypothetical protein